MKKTLVVLMMGSALALAAQDVRFGVQGGLSLPSSDLSNNAYFGITGGGHAKVAFREGHGLMARADATFYSQNNGVGVTDLAVGADYTYHFERRQQGLYALAGLSQHSFHTSFPGRSVNDSGLGLDLGAGYDLDRHLGLQARYSNNSFTNYNYASFNIGVTYTF